jgi:hypothetical protein
LRVEKIIDIVLMRDLWNFSFFGRVDVSPTYSEFCRFVSGSWAKTPGLISRNNFVEKTFVCIGHRDNDLARCDPIFPLLRCQGVRNKTCTQLSLPQILFQNPKNCSLGMFKDSAIILDAIRRPFLNKSATAAMFTSVRFDFGRPPLLSSSTSSLPSRNQEYHLKTLDRFRTSFPQAFCTNTSVSVAD